MIANFVQTIDGVVSFRIPRRSGGGPISGGSAEDRFVMGLLRSMADAVLVGSGTLHGDPGHVRIPEFIYPEAKDLYADLRRRNGKPPLPLNVILTASGRIDFDEPTFHTEGLQALIITTEEGAERLHRKAPLPAVVRSTGGAGATAPGSVLRLLREEFGVQLLLHEGGPTIFGQFLGAGAIDELFLTLAPQIAGRFSGTSRPSIAGETIFSPESARWFTLHSLKRASEHLLLRYTAMPPRSGMQPPSINSSVSAPRFFFTVTLDRPDLSRRLTVVPYLLRGSRRQLKTVQVVHPRQAVSEPSGGNC